MIELIELPRIDRSQAEMPLRQFLDAHRIVELGPLRAQCRDGVVLAPDVDAQLRDLLGLASRFELDPVDVDRRDHERDDHANIEETHHRARLPRTSSSEGRCGKTWSGAAAMAGACVRSAARSLA